MAIKRFNSVEGFSVGEPGSTIDVIDNIGNVTTGNLTVTTFSDLGNVSNVKITGGTAGYTLRTDGTGNLSWGIDSAAAGGSNTQVQFNDNNIFAGSANFTFDNTSNTLTVTQIISNGAQLTNITGANVTGQVANAIIAGTVYVNAQPNITSVGTLSSLAVTANISAGNIIINDGSIIGSNLVNANYYVGNASLLNSITGANVTGTVANANYSTFSGTVTTNAQPNITSVGILASLDVTGNISSGNANLGNLVIANFFSGDGGYLSNLQISTATVANANYANFAGTVITNAQPNITSVGTLTNLDISGNLSTGDATINGNLTVTGNYQYSNVTILNVKDPVIEQGGNTNGSPLTANDGADRGQLLHYYTTKPVDAFMGWKNSTGEFVFASNATLAANNVATVNQYGNIHVGNIIAGNLITGDYFSGNGYLLTGITGANVTGTVANANYATYAGTVTTNAQPNITSVGILSSLDVTGNISSGNANLGNLVTANYFNGQYGNFSSNLTSGNANLGNIASANYFIGNASLLSDITGSNVTGQVGNALIAGTVYTNAQPNITSVGTLSGLTTTGTANFVGASNVSLGTISNLHITGGTSGYILQTDGSGTLAWVSPSSTGIAGSDKQVQFNDSGAFGANANFTFNKVTSTLNVIGAITRDSKSVPTFVSSTTQPTNPKLGDEWYDTNNDIIYQYIYDGSNYNWVDVSSGYITANSSAVANTIALRDANANLVANYFIGDGSYLTGIGSAGSISNGTSNITIPVINGNVNTSVGGTSNVLVVTTTGANLLGTFNTTGNLTSGNADLGNLTTSNYFSGNGSLITYITGSNVSGNVTSAVQSHYSNIANSVAGADVSGNVSSAVQSHYANIANSVSGTNVSGNVSSAVQSHYANIANSVAGVDVTGQVSNALVAGTVYTNAQPNITSVGTLSTLAVTANITSGNANLGNLVVANFFSGDGGYLSNLQISTATVANANYANFAGTVLTNAQPNITSVGSLSGLVVSGDTTLTGNLIVSGTVEYTNVTSLKIQDPVIEQGGGANGAILTNNDGKDRGQLLHYYTTAPIDAFMGWKNSTGEFVFASNASLSNDVATVNQYGNIHAGNANLGNLVTSNYFTGNGSLLTSLTGTNVVGNVSSAVQSHYANIANSVSGSNVSGNVSSAIQSHYANIANSVAGVDVSGQVSNALVAGTVYTNAQPNITSVGTLTTLTVSGNVSSGNANLGNLVVANFFSGDGGYLSNLQISTATVANANYANFAGTVLTNAQPNITSLGTLSSLTITGNLTSGNANLGNLTTSNYFIGNGYLLISTNGSNVLGNVTSAVQSHYANIANSVSGSNVSGNVTSAVQSHYANIANSVSGSNVSGQVANSLVAGTVYTNAQPNITSVGSLSGLVVSNSSGIVDFTTTANVTLGNVSNLHIAGGSAGYTLRTDGLGNLSWAVDSAAAGGNTTEVQFNDTGSLTGNSNFTFNKTTAVLTVTGNITSGNANLGNLLVASFFSGNGSLLSSITGSNVVGNVTSAIQAHYANIANSVSGSNVSGQVSNALIAGTVYTNVQPNITSVGSLSGLIVSNSSGVVDFTTTANVTLGNVSNLHIAGGSAGYTLRTDGTGNLSWAVDSAAAGGNTTEVQYNDGGSLTGNSNFTFNASTGLLTVTGNILSNNANLGNLTTSNYFNGNGSLITYITGSNVSGNVTSAVQSHYANIANSVAGANVSGNVTSAIQSHYANIANSVIGTNVSGNVTSAVQSHYANIANSVSGSNVSGQVSNSLVAGTVYTNAQPNITSVGTLISLDVTSNVTTGNVKTDHLLYANGDPYVFTTSAAGSNTYVQFNDNTVFAGSANFTFNKGTNTLSVTNIIANGSGLTSLTGANVTGQVSNSLIAGTVYTNAQPNITSVGTLSGLSVNGTTNLGDVSNITITGGTAGYVLTTNGSGAVSWQAAAGGGGTSGFVNIVKNRFTGNAVANTFSLTTVPGSVDLIEVNIDGLLQVSNTYSLAGSIVSFPTAPASGQIIEVTTYGSANVTGGDGAIQFSTSSNLLSSSANLNFDSVTNTLTSNYFSGNGSYLTGLNGANISGIVANANYANYAGTVVTSAQPNITSVGTLASLSVTGNISGNNITSNSNLTVSGGYLTIGSGLIAVSSGNAGMFTSGISNINVGLAGNVTLGSTSGTVTARGTLTGANITTDGNLSVTNTATITNLKVNDFYSNRTPVVVTTNTVVDSFPINKYRSAKYTMRINSDDGYQAVEALLIHNGIQSYVTIYGSLSTIGYDIVTLSTDINSGNVRMLATTVSTNTTVNMLGTYVAD